MIHINMLKNNSKRNGKVNSKDQRTDLSVYKRALISNSVWDDKVGIIVFCFRYINNLMSNAR